MDQQEFPFITGRTENWYRHFARYFDSLYKTQHILIIQYRNYTSQYLPKEGKKLHPQKYLRMNVYSIVIFNWQNLEEANMSFMEAGDSQIFYLVLAFEGTKTRHFLNNAASAIS